MHRRLGILVGTLFLVFSLSSSLCRGAAVGGAGEEAASSAEFAARSGLISANDIEPALSAASGTFLPEFDQPQTARDKRARDKFGQVLMPDGEMAVAISAGNGHTCALTSAGGVKCWGYNMFSQMGDGSRIERWVPVDVSGLSTGVIAISAGEYHTCALMAGGGVKCWGANDDGQLGDGSTIERNAPVDVSGLTEGAIAVSAGYSHTCALTSAGGVKCWGSNGFGQLGDNRNSYGGTPVDVIGLTSGAIAVTAGGEHTCALTMEGGVKCWGDDIYGQLGDDSIGNHWTPVDVSGLISGVIAVSAGNLHTCALMDAGGVKCWGYNGYGQLGDGSTNNSDKPVEISGLPGRIITVSAGHSHTCALAGSGGVKCWGDNSGGQLGDGSAIERHTPVNVNGLNSNASAISTGGAHTCALMSKGGVMCWGYNGAGRLGNGSASRRWAPGDVNGMSGGVTGISASYLQTCALTSAGGIKCWGANQFGQLGDGSNSNRWTPGGVSGLDAGITAINTNGYHACALTARGGVMCWGNNDAGQLGDGTRAIRSVPVDVSGLTGGVAAVSAGYYHTCALTSEGGVKCWGSNGFGQLGDGSTEDRWTPVDVGGLTSNVLAVSTGATHTCVVTAGGGVKCWGYNDFGQLGDGTADDRATPVDVSGLTSGAMAVSAGGGHTCAVTSEGRVKCWGYNISGQLGDGSTTKRLTPVDVSGLSSRVIAISAGDSHTCALTSSGGIKCWGTSWYGQLGDGSNEYYRTIPVDAKGLTSGMVAVSAGNMHTCAVTVEGGVKCWGDNGVGQLGADPGWTPVSVAGFGQAPGDFRARFPLLLH